MSALAHRAPSAHLATPRSRGTALSARCAAGLAALAAALDLPHSEPDLLQLASDALGPEGSRPAGDQPAWRSHLSDDGSPYEWSVALDRPAELRFLVEPQGRPANLESNWQAGLAANARFASRWGAALERFDQVQDLFEPQDPAARFSIWHAICIGADSSAMVKVYLDPNARGAARAPELVREALHRLALPEAWDGVAQLARSPRQRILFFALDLSPHRDARVKVYFAHDGATAHELDRLLAASGSWNHGDVVELCNALTGGTGPYARRPLISCLAFAATGRGSPVQLTAHVPVRCYVRDDEVALRRLQRYLGERRQAERLLAAVAQRPLRVGRGLLAYVSVRPSSRGRRTTLYLSAEEYAITAPCADLDAAAA